MIDEFHKLYYHNPQNTWGNTRYKGHRVLKCPLDLWVYSEIIWEEQPDIIIETGTMFGGSALWLGDQLDLIQKGQVYTVDIEDKGQPPHDRVEYLLGSSTDDSVVEYLRRECQGWNSVMVILDSDHSQEHVARELEIYSEFVTPGSYLIVEDTNVNGHPVATDHGPGPWEAVQQWLPTSDYSIDSSREKYYLTFNPNGYLRRNS